MFPGVWAYVSQIDTPLPSSSQAPSTWYDAVATPQWKPSGNVRSAVMTTSGDPPRMMPDGDRPVGSYARARDLSPLLHARGRLGRGPRPARGPGGPRAPGPPAGARLGPGAVTGVGPDPSAAERR